LQQTQASRELAEVTNARDSNLVKQGWLTRQQGDNDRLTLQAQQAAVGVAQSNVAAQEAQIDTGAGEGLPAKSWRRSTGSLTQRSIDNGSLVQSGSTFMFTLMHPDVIRTQLYVLRMRLTGFFGLSRCGGPRPRNSGSDFSRQGHAHSDSTAARQPDAADRDRCSQSRRRALVPESIVRLELFIPRKTPSMIIPADAVVFDQNGLHVAVVENGIARLQKITIARDFGKEVEVHDGVKPGDQVILNPMVNLADGSRVAARKPQTS
jgi:hypothetical protein